MSGLFCCKRWGHSHLLPCMRSYVAASQVAIQNQPAIMRVLDAARQEGGQPSSDLPGRSSGLSLLDDNEDLDL